ncbi:MAG: hypothetical protein ACKO81_05850 [Planctomycetota bacterium]
MKANDHEYQATSIRYSLLFTLASLELFSLLRPEVSLAAIELSVCLIAAIVAGWLHGKSLEQTVTRNSNS